MLSVLKQVFERFPDALDLINSSTGKKGALTNGGLTQLATYFERLKDGQTAEFIRRQIKTATIDPLTDDAIAFRIEEAAVRDHYENDLIDPASGVHFSIWKGLPRGGTFNVEQFIQHGQTVFDKWQLNHLSFSLADLTSQNVGSLCVRIETGTFLKNVDSISIQFPETEIINEVECYSEEVYRNIEKVLQSLFRRGQHLDSIKRVHFSSDDEPCTSQDKLIVGLQGCSLLKQVTGLWLDFSGGDADLVELVNPTDMPLLTDITLCNADLSKIAPNRGKKKGTSIIQGLVASGICKQLAALRFIECNLTNADLESLAANKKLESLKHLVIAKNSGPAFSLAKAKIEKLNLSCLMEFSIAETEVVELEGLASSGLLSHIEVLDVRREREWAFDNIEDQSQEIGKFVEGMVKFAKKNNLPLRVLNLSYWDMMSDVAKILSNASCFGRVRILSLDGIPEEGQKWLAGILKSNYYAKLIALSAQVTDTDGDDLDMADDDDRDAESLVLESEQHDSLMSALFYGDAPTRGLAVTPPTRAVVYAKEPAAEWFAAGRYIFTIMGE